MIFGRYKEGSITWNPRFLRKFYDWPPKPNVFGRFREEEDKMVLGTNKNWVFSTRVFYNALEIGGRVAFPLKRIWDSCLCVSAWEII